MKKHKSSSPVQPSASKNTTELFVLTPELLEKLGINLSTIQNSESQSPIRSLEKGSDQKSDHNNSNSLPESKNESSIIETTKLIKDSVFLSPTFLQTASNVMPDEELTVDNEYVQTNDIVPLERDNVPSSYDIDGQNISELDQVATEIYDNAIFKPNSEIYEKHIDAIQTNECIQEYHFENHDGNLILKGVSHKESGDDDNFRNILHPNFPVEEHLDEAYMSDCSNSYSGCSSENIYTELNKQKVTSKIKEKHTNNDLQPSELIKNMSGTINPIDIENESFSDSSVTGKDKIASQTIPICSRSENIEVLNIYPAIPSGKLISWTSVDQKDKIIQIAKTDYDGTTSSIINFTDFRHTTIQSGETKNLSHDSDCIQNLANEPVSELKSHINNNSEMTSEDNDEIQVTDSQKNIIQSGETKNLLHDSNLENEPVSELNGHVKKSSEITSEDDNEIQDADSHNIVIQSGETKNFMHDSDCIQNLENEPISELNGHINNSSEMTSEDDDEFLSIAQNRKKNIVHLNQIANAKKKKYNETNSNGEKNPSKESIDSVKSKSCIQGVEKPGGEYVKNNKIACAKVQKTYQKKITQKQILARVPISHEVMASDLFQLSNNPNPDIQSINFGALTSQNAFCICYDFGNLSYYDCEMLYEHIHFWQHKNINSNPDILYSIYNDDYTVTKHADVDFIEDDHLNERDDKESGDIICLNMITSRDEDISSAVSDSSLSERANSSSIRKMSVSASEIIGDQLDETFDNIAKGIKNLKKLSSTIEQDEPKDPLPGTKNKIKCGVCNQLVSEIEWETHKETEHSSTAWEADQEFDLKNNDLLNVLNRRLKLFGYLKCPICNAEIKHLIKFTQHMRKCITHKKKINTAASPKASSTKNTRNSTSAEDIDLSQSVVPKYTNTENTNVLPRPTRKISLQENNATLSVQTSTNEKNKSPVISTDLNTSASTTSRTSHIESIALPKQTNKRFLTITPVTLLTSTSTSIGADTTLPSDSKMISTANENNETPKSSKRKPSISKEGKATLTAINQIEIEIKTTEPADSRKNKPDPSASTRHKTEETNINEASKSKLTHNDTFPLKMCTTIEAVPSSRRSRKSANIETCVKYTKNIKRSSNNVTGVTPVKKAKTSETDDKLISYQYIELTPRSPIEIVDQSSKVKVNDTSASRLTTDNVIASTSADCDPIKSIITYTNKKIPSFSEQEIIESGSSGSCPLIQSADRSINNVVDSSVSKNISANIAVNEPQTSKESSSIVVEFEVPINTLENIIKCGVCEKNLMDSEWIEHIAKEHHYIAWREGETPIEVEDQEAVRQHLQIIVKQNNVLICSKCGLVRKMAKPFLRHIKKCDGDQQNVFDFSTASADFNSTQELDDNSPLSMMSKKGRGRKSAARSVTCGVCSKRMEHAEWIEHIRVEHKYLAWVAGETPLNTNDEREVKSHLNYISKNYGGLICSKCGSTWSYVKKYLLHEQLCGSLLNNFVKNIPKNAKIEVEIRPIVKCGVCKMDVEGKNWIKHIQEAHEYMAWIDGETPLNLNDPEDVKQHLSNVAAVAGELICSMCGVTRRYVRSYQMHLEACAKSGFNLKIEEPGTVSKDEYECGVCHEKGPINKWREHAMMEHYNIAWMVGELPINIRNPYAVQKYLKEYQKRYSLKCKVCRITRTSGYGFYAHIMACGKTEKELEEIQNTCEICNNKYLCIYRNQHIAWHKDQEYRREQRLLNADEPDDEPAPPAPPPPPPAGKRKAAQKAKQVIKKYASKGKDGKIVCLCGATFKDAEAESRHICSHKQRELDADVCVKMEPLSEPESIDSDEDSIVSDVEEEEPEPEPEPEQKKKRKRTGEGSTKITRMSYRVNNYTTYLARCFRDFCALHYTSDNLFNQWRDSEFKELSTEEVAKYLPPLTESSKIRFGHLNNEWMTFKRFESKKTKGYSIFVGGAVQCMAWAPPHACDETLGHFLAVCALAAPDVPRLAPAARPAHAALIQIWSFRAFNFPPRLSLGLALDYGIVWGMSWCPSGARDLLPHENCDDSTDTDTGTDTETTRLGLLAIACSNGSAYILAVPCPPKSAEMSENEQASGSVFYKLKPVAELRLSMTTERRTYQATSISWSAQKGHEIIIVGYSDGTTALYDLNTECPFLKETEDKVTIFYPFQDRHSENTSITGVDICPTANESYPIGGYATASITGGQLRGWAADGPAARSHLPAAAACYSPLWPAVILAGDAPFTIKAVNELEWWGGGRRLGAARAAAACARCGRVLAAAAPAVRLLRAHPCYPDLKKQIIATIVMVPLGQKGKRKQVNDDLSVVVEPLTYDDAIAKYGLEMTLVPKTEQAAAQQVCNENDMCPERFPLSDVVSAAFVPSARFHEKLALATHSGFIFVINT